MPGATADRVGVFTTACTTAEAMPDNSRVESVAPRSPADLAAEHGLSEDDEIALLEAKDEGKSMTAACTSIAPKSDQALARFNP